MIVTLSPAGDLVLSRTKDFCDALLKVLEGLSGGSCFVDGRIGRTAATNELVLMSQDHEPIVVPNSEFGDPATLQRIVKEWSSS